MKARVAWMTVEAMVTKSQLDKVEREEEEEEGDRGGLSIEDKVGMIKTRVVRSQRALTLKSRCRT